MFEIFHVCSRTCKQAYIQNVFIVKCFDEEVLHDMLWYEKQSIKMKWKFIGEFFTIKEGI